MIERFHIIKRYAALICFVCLFLSCSNKYRTDKVTLIEYIKNEENGLTHEVILGPNNYRVTYRPTELILEQELKANASCNRDSLFEVYADCRYFVLSLKHDSLEIFGRRYNNFEELLKRISFNMSDYVTMVDQKSGDVFYLSDYVYPRMYNSTSSTSILLCFKDPRLTTTKDLTLHVKDFLSEAQQQEILNFNFLKTHIDNIPTLQL